MKDQTLQIIFNRRYFLFTVALLCYYRNGAKHLSRRVFSKLYLLWGLFLNKLNNFFFKADDVDIVIDIVMLVVGADPRNAYCFHSL